MTTNARITPITSGVDSEMIAEQVHLFYNPETGSGSVSFQGRASLYVGGAYHSLAGDWNILQANLADIQARAFAASGTVDPVTGADLSKVSAAGLVMILKAAYDVLFNERAAA